MPQPIQPGKIPVQQDTTQYVRPGIKQGQFKEPAGRSVWKAPSSQMPTSKEIQEQQKAQEEFKAKWDAMTPEEKAEHMKELKKLGDALLPKAAPDSTKVED